jgi:hypothetical protein
MTTVAGIGFSTTNGVPSRLVRLFTKSRASHSFLLVVLEGNEFVLQADWNGVVLTPNGQYVKDNVVVDIVPSPVPIELSKALALADTPYDYSGFVGMAWVALGRWFKKKWKNPLNSRKALFCSEMIGNLLKDAGWAAASHLDTSSLSPQDLLDLLKRHS